MLAFRTPYSAAIVGALLLTGGPPALGRGSQVTHDDPWNPEHIERLPPEIRNAVVRMCGRSPHAAHYFATYLDNSRIIKLHFEHFQCDDGGGFCRGTGCLLQEYVARGGQYRLIRSYYGRDGD